MLPGDVAFRLYDTYGFPVDMTEDILREAAISVDHAGFQACMDSQRKRGREARKAAGEGSAAGSSASSRFVGDGIYETESTIAALSVDGEERREVRAGETVHIVAAETPFYGESGGQVGDRGVIETADGALVEVTDTLKPRPDLTVHVGTVVRGALAAGQTARLHGRPRTPRSRPPQPLGHPHPARRPAPHARRTGAPGRLAGRARPAALRLQPARRRSTTRRSSASRRR